MLLALFGFVPSALGIESGNPWGTLTGRVIDVAGVPQMGATVVLLDRFDRVISRTLTNDRGSFLFRTLMPDTYSVKVTLSSFVPALKRNIFVQPGMQSFLAISLNSLLSSIELIAPPPGQHPIMNDDWKWVLRGNQATRPVLRIVPQQVDVADPDAVRARNQIFSDTHGLLKLSAGDAGVLANAGNQTDLGTAFALATSLFGSHQLSVSGNLGYASHTGVPTAGFRTSFSRASESGPEVNVTMRQVFLPSRVGGMTLVPNQGNLPSLQTLAITFVDRRQLTDSIDIEYGSSLESVSFLNRLNYLSPFGRLRWRVADHSSLEFAYSSGAPPTELLRSEEVNDAELQHDLTTLALFPRVSLRGGLAHVQRTQNMEIGYRRNWGRRTVSMSVYRESTTNATMNSSVPDDFFGPGELLPDLASSGSVFNAGRFRRSGYTAAISQPLGDSLTATLGYGYQGAMAVDGRELVSSDPDEVRKMMRTEMHHSLTVRASGILPGAGTRYMTSYQFTDYASLQLVHLSLTQRATTEPGLNIYVRQPIPGLGNIMPGRLEATAEVRNLLGQGYVSLDGPVGQRMILVQSPRAVRGGLSLIF